MVIPIPVCHVFTTDSLISNFLSRKSSEVSFFSLPNHFFLLYSFKARTKKLILYLKGYVVEQVSGIQKIKFIAKI